MTGKEALRILNQITEIRHFLLKGNDRSAFFHLGILAEELSLIARIEGISSSPHLNFETDD